jgi:hypothetical protein
MATLSTLILEDKQMIRVTMLVAMVWLLLTTFARADTYNVYAPPNTWGQALQVKGHIGSVTYTISYSALGNTSVIGEVTYAAANNRMVTRQFNGSITFRTEGVGAPRVRFKGTPFGSAVRVTVSP